MLLYNYGTVTVANRQVEPQTGVNFRPVLAGVFLLGFRSISAIVDITIMVNDKKYYHANWIAILVVFAVSLVHKTCCHSEMVTDYR